MPGRRSSSTSTTEWPGACCISLLPRSRTAALGTPWPRPISGPSATDRSAPRSMVGVVLVFGAHHPEAAAAQSPVESAPELLQPPDPLEIQVAEQHSAQMGEMSHAVLQAQEREQLDAGAQDHETDGPHRKDEPEEDLAVGKHQTVGQHDAEDRPRRADRGAVREYQTGRNRRTDAAEEVVLHELP